MKTASPEHFTAKASKKLSCLQTHSRSLDCFSQTRETSQANQLREGTVYEKQLACTMPLKQQTLEVITEVFPLLGPLEKTMSALSDSQVPKVCHAKT